MYINNLLIQLEAVQAGSYIGAQYIGCPTVADDFTLISKSDLEMQLMLDLTYRYSTRERYIIHPEKSSIVHRTPYQKDTVMLSDWKLGDHELSVSSQATHLGLIRATKGEVTLNIDEQISCARRTFYNLTRICLHRSDGLSAKICSSIRTTYVMPRLIYGLEIFTLQKQHVSQLEPFHLSMLRKIQSLPTRTAKCIIYLLLSVRPILAELHSRQLSLLGSILRSNNKALPNIMIRHLIMKEDDCNSWFIKIKHLLKKYELPNIDKLKAAVPTKENWKSIVKSAINTFWTQTLLSDCEFKSTLAYCNTGDLSIGCQHLSVSSPDHNVKDVKRGVIKARFLNGTYILQSRLSRFNQNKVDPTCPLCQIASEGYSHIIIQCGALHNYRKHTLQETFGQNYPEEFDGALDCVSIAVTCNFNRHGTLLAVGCNDGRIVVWDFLTRGIAKIISAHVHPVCSLSWNRSGQKLLSAATDNTVSVWDVLTGECDKTFRFPSPILKVQFNPRNSTKFLVCLMKHAAVLMDITGSRSIIPLDDESDLNIVASYDRRGGYVYTGNAKGRILVFRTHNLKLVASFRVTTGTLNTTAIKSIEFARRGSCFLVNSADRIIRVYEAGEVMACGKDGEPEAIQKLQDLVNKTLWKKCCFSGDGEFIVAGSARQHSLYIWEKSVGNLVKILHGTKGELLLDVVWHPVRPIICSISSGVVSIWAQNQVENWSAFAPDFKELDENVEYEERESEFDIEDEDKEKEELKGALEEDIEVDVTTVEPIQAFLSSDEEGEDVKALLYLPVSPEIDEPEETWQQIAVDTPAEEQATPAPQEKKRSHATDTPSSTRRKKTRPVDVTLPDAPVDEIHPLLNVKKSQPDKAQPKKTTRPKPQRSTRPDKTKSRDRGTSRVDREKSLDPDWSTEHAASKSSDDGTTSGT